MLRAVWCRPHLHHAVLSQLKRGDPCFVLQQTDAQKIGLMSEKDPLCERCQNDGCRAPGSCGAVPRHRWSARLRRGTARHGDV